MIYIKGRFNFSSSSVAREMFFQFQVFGLIFVVYLIVRWFRLKPLRDFAAKIPGYNGLPLIGAAYKFIGVAPEDFYQSVSGLIKKFDSICKFWFGPYLLLWIFDHRDIKTVLTSQNCNHKPEIFYHSFFKHGLVLENGEKYKVQRKAANPAFNPSALRSYNPIINRKMTKFLESFEDHVEKSKVIDFKLFSQDFALDTVIETMFGVDDIDREDRMNLVNGIEE